MCSPPQSPAFYDQTHFKCFIYEQSMSAPGSRAFYLLCHFQCSSVQGKLCKQDSECACVNPDNTTLSCNLSHQCAILSPSEVKLRNVLSKLPVSGIPSSCIIRSPNERNSYLLPFTKDRIIVFGSFGQKRLFQCRCNLVYQVTYFLIFLREGGPFSTPRHALPF